MKTINVSQAEGPVLDWLVAKCEDFRDDFAIIRVWNNRVTKIIPGDYETSEVYTSYSPSADWSQGGPIIEQEDIELTLMPRGYPARTFEKWVAYKGLGEEDCVDVSGPNPLVAAMRCFVASKLGDTVEVPEELT